jgi:hypothetical protein
MAPSPAPFVADLGVPVGVEALLLSEDNAGGFFFFGVAALIAVVRVNSSFTQLAWRNSPADALALSN